LEGRPLPGSSGDHCRRDQDGQSHGGRRVQRRGGLPGDRCAPRRRP